MARSISRKAAWFLGVVTLLVAGGAAAPAPGGETPDNARQAERIRAMREILEGCSVEAVTPEAREKVERPGEPIYAFDDPTRAFPYGTVWAWRQSGRPVALLTVSAEKKPEVPLNWLCELTSLAPGPLSASVPSGLSWEPTEPGLTPRQLPKAQAVAGDAVKRLRQMKELARRFKAYEFYTPLRSNLSQRFELRLLPQPILRYDDPKSGLIDGALFLLVSGGNPEVVLAIEATRAGASDPAWSYSLGRMSSAELHAELDSLEVWKQPGKTRQLTRATYGCFTLPRSVD